MRKNISILMNTDKLGGAERSILLQFSKIKNCNLTFYIPRINNCHELENYIVKNQLGHVAYYSFSKSIYAVSRTNLFLSLFALLDFFKLFFDMGGLKKTLKSDFVYLNGNKAAFLFFALTLVRSFKGRIIWHLRDYYFHSKITDFIWWLLLRSRERKLTIVCNSESVQSGLSDTPLAIFPRQVIYNPSGLTSINSKSKKFETLGFVSMLAPWKGVHEVVFFAWLYEEELRSIGIKKIAIYGDNLYETHGEHQNYKEELKKMLNKFQSSLISFEGMQVPQKIFSEIDCLIHYSLNKEPFGRVIIEAYDSLVPVITTALGGAGEIVDDKKTGLKVIPYDRYDLFEKIKILACDEDFREVLIKNGKEKASFVQSEIDLKMQNLFAD